MSLAFLLALALDLVDAELLIYVYHRDNSPLCQGDRHRHELQEALAYLKAP